MTYKPKKLFKGYVSVRSYIVDTCLKKKSDLIIQYKDEKMTIPYIRLTNLFQFHKKQFQSKYSNHTYELVDFNFIPDTYTNKQCNLL